MSGNSCTGSLLRLNAPKQTITAMATAIPAGFLSELTVRFTLLPTPGSYIPLCFSLVLGLAGPLDRRALFLTQAKSNSLPAPCKAICGEGVGSLR